MRQTSYQMDRTHQLTWQFVHSEPLQLCLYVFDRNSSMLHHPMDVSSYVSHYRIFCIFSQLCATSSVWQSPRSCKVVESLVLLEDTEEHLRGPSTASSDHHQSLPQHT